MKLEYRTPTVSEYNKLRSLVGWWETDEAATETALRNSLFGIVALEQDAVVGFGRIIGDGGLYFHIQDLIVHPEFRKKRARQVPDEGIDGLHKRQCKPPGAFIGLMAAQGLEKYYVEFGFKVRDDDAPGMYQVF